jgi:hypothetical protein
MAPSPRPFGLVVVIVAAGSPLPGRTTTASWIEGEQKGGRTPAACPPLSLTHCVLPAPSEDADLLPDLPLRTRPRTDTGKGFAYRWLLFR